MRKALLYFFAIVFLFVQSIALAHTHSDGDIHHKDCELCHFINNATGDVPPEVGFPAFVPQPTDFSPIEPQYLVSGERIHFYFSTAPPSLV